MNGEQYDAVIVGSGFGGSITALRLAEAGKSVLVLERGARYASGEFPRDPRDVDRVFWRPERRAAARGLYDLRFFSGVSALVASGVGGGSLIYANVHVRPDAQVFDDPRWPRAITRASLAPYFERAEAMLGVRPMPASEVIPKRDAFAAAGRILHRDVFDPGLAVEWPACRRCSQCELGCQFGAKNTLDRTYLARAEAAGAVVLPGVLVTHVAREPGAGYRVFYRRLDDGASLSAAGRRVVVAAGTLGTNEILLRSRDDAGTLPALSRRLGHGYSANGDFLGNIENSRSDLQPWNGPDVTSVMRFTDEAPIFTVVAPSFTRGVTSVLASLGQPHLRWLRAVAPAVRPLLGRLVPLLFAEGIMSKPLRLKERDAGDPARMTNLFAIGRDNANGRFVLRRGRLDLLWNYADENRALIARMARALRTIADAYGGTFAPLALWDAFRRILTVHSLGGCAMADGDDRGVVGDDGEVFGYPGLFVADGSVIPTSIGFHPALTIAAVSERIAERVVQAS